ncbi:hypothetical protein D3C74_419440 [compost metagenome]
MLPVPDHQGLFRSDGILVQHILDHLTLLGAGTIQIAASDMLKISVQPVMPENFFGEYSWFRSSDV